MLFFFFKLEYIFQSLFDFFKLKKLWRTK